MLAEIISNNPGVAAIGGIGTPVSDTLIPDFVFFDAKAYATGAQHAVEGIKDTKMPWLYGAGICIDAAAYRKAIARFPFTINLGRTGNSLGSCDDNEMCYKLVMEGHKLYYSPRLKFSHFLPGQRMTLDYYKRLIAGAGISSARLYAYQMAMHPNDAGLMKRLTSLRMKWNLLWLKWKNSGVFRNPRLLHDEKMFQKAGWQWYLYHYFTAIKANAAEIRADYQRIKQVL